MNRVELMGRLTRNPEMKYSQCESNMAIARYTLAVDRKGKKDSSQGQNTDFISCVAFGKTAEFAVKYLKKGMRIVVCGRIITSSYKNNEGKMIYTTSVAVDEHYFAEGRTAGSVNGEKNVEAEADADGFMKMPDGIEDEIPFN